ncbi:hypothetical protein BCD67_03225 [Oscillatoriales cyanobacterium USR001]|nr:hypothetical protein BCD67_03225 [Oscillatoriales cyanobacterium USR001]
MVMWGAEVALTQRPISVLDLSCVVTKEGYVFFKETKDISVAREIYTAFLGSRSDREMTCKLPPGATLLKLDYLMTDVDDPAPLKMTIWLDGNEQANFTAIPGKVGTMKPLDLTNRRSIAFATSCARAANCYNSRLWFIKAQIEFTPTSPGSR